MASCEESGQKTPLQQCSSLDQGHHSSPGQAQGRRGRKILLGTLVGVLLVVVLAAACTVAAVSSPESSTRGQHTGATARAAAVKEGRLVESKIFGQQARNRRVAPSPFPTRPPPINTDTLPQPLPPSSSSDGSCISRETEMNTPAAHIKGHGIRRGKWIQSTGGSVVPGYQQRWQCNDVYVNNPRHVQEQAFVDGGVWFNQTDKSIYVPKCGYYLVYSQVFFVIDQHSISEGVTVFHNLKIKHNCTWESDSGPIQLQAKASVAPFGSENPDGGVATTFTSDVVHLCSGGSVWIEIPDGANGVPCCPRGDDSGTFLGLVLIADTPCASWPPEITMTNEF